MAKVMLMISSNAVSASPSHYTLSPTNLSPPPVSLPIHQQAIHNASRRWPALTTMVEQAAALLDAHPLYTHPTAPHILAWCWQPEQWVYRHLTATRTGFACTCSAWPPPTRAGPGDGQYCPHILAWLLTVYLRQPLASLPFSAMTLWQKSLVTLQQEMTKGTYTTWLAWTEAIPETSTPLCLTVQVANPRAQAWLTQRLAVVIRRAVSNQAGYPVQVRFVVGR